MMFSNIYKDKVVLLTGNTGFKGSWLTIWLLKLGAKVVGISNCIPTEPSIFNELNLEKKISYYQEDITNLSKVSEIVSTVKPDFLFHLAAQPIVSLSYLNPIETISSNVIGTANILEALKVSNHECTAVLITSDKAYDNVEQIMGYNENDTLGGKDIYSGSKGAAELIIKSYFHSFFKSQNSSIKIAVGRAGNVIGGGDWAKDRIIADCMRAWSDKKVVEIRSPKSTRPWQHVLEPLSGYLLLGQKLYMNSNLNGECFNFGPKSDQDATVEDLITDLSMIWNFKRAAKAYKIRQNNLFHEANLLKLNCDKSLFKLDWRATLDYSKNIKFTGEWYYDFYQNHSDMYAQTIIQIDEYESIARNNHYSWAL